MKIMGSALGRRHGMFGETRTEDVTRMGATASITWMTDASSTCELNLAKTVPSLNIGMGKSFKSMAAHQILRKTRSSRTWRTQALPLRPPSGRVGYLMMVRVDGGMIPMVHPLL